CTREGRIYYDYPFAYW
nr:immunoglobulin heavy chain junction region [Mus musculus]